MTAPRTPVPVSGFTMVELVVVMILIGVLAAIGIPHLVGDNSNQTAVYHDQVLSALRRAQTLAVGHRRLACVTVGSGAVQILLAAGTGPGTCSVAPAGIAADDYKSGDASVLSSVQATTSAGASAPTQLYFQPDGRISTDAGGAAPAWGTVTIQGSQVQRTIAFDGRTGYVE